MDEYFRNRADVDDPDLLQDRRKNDARLKSRFEHIFAKYEKDFTGIGDEIDLESGEIIVDNGHLTNMRHEVDPGKSTSSGLVRAFAAGEGLEVESTEITEDDDDEEDDVVITGISRRAGLDEDTGETSSAEYSSSGVITDGEDDVQPDPSPFEPDELSSDFYPENADLTTKKRKRAKPAPKDLGVSSREVSNGAQTTESSKTTSRDTSPGDMLENVPFLAESMRAMEATREGGPMDEGAIQALGQSIANQLAQYMTQAPHRKSQKPPRRSNVRESPWDFPALPRDKRQRTPTPPREPMSSSAALFTMSPGDGGSIWAPAQHPRQRKLKRPRTKLVQETINDTTTDNEGDIDPLQSDSPRRSPRNTTDIQPVVEVEDTDERPPRECNNCGETNTPNFRRGPDGEDLCNACGMYFYRYGLLKPPYNPNPAPSPPRPEPRHGTFSVLIPTNHGILPGDEYDIPVTPETGNTVGYPANTARRVVANGVRMTRFTVEEDEKLIKLREIDDYPWETIGRIVSGRSAYAVQCRYSKCLRGKNVEARRRLLEHGVPVKQPEEESDEKDFVVIDYDEEARGNTVDGAPATSLDPYFNDRSPLPDASLASTRMAQRSMRTSYHDLHDGQCRVFKRFTEEENKTIVRLREDENMAWEQIHRFLPGRTLLSLQKHYRRELYDPPDGVDPALFTEDKKPLKFTKEEDDLIMKMKDVEKMSFAEMTDYLSERTEDVLAARYKYVVSRDAAAKRSALRPQIKIKKEEEPPVRQLAPFYPDSTPYQQWIPGSTTQPPPGHPYANSTLNTFGRINPSASTGYTSALTGHPPQTPAAPILLPDHPPRPMSVGPSAWAATHPASKGPLPFQPARKGPVPILPAPRWPVPVDPFEHRPISRKKVLGSERDAGPGPRRLPRVQSAGSHAPIKAPVTPVSRVTPMAVFPSQVAHSILHFTPAEPCAGAPVGDAASDDTGRLPSQSNLIVESKQVAPDRIARRYASPGSSQTPQPNFDNASFANAGPKTHSKENSTAQIIEISSDPPQSLEVEQVPTPLPTSMDISKSTTPEVLDFSNEEDRLIKKWREKEGACWSEITERLPHRTQQVVIDRYYDKIVGNSASVKAAVAQNKQDSNSKHGRRYTDAESERVLSMRDAGLSWQEMADQLPGRTSGSVQNHFYGALLSSAKLKKRYAERTSNKGPLAATPLLRQALSNSVRRENEQEPSDRGAYAEYSLPPPGASGSWGDGIWGRPASVPSVQQQSPHTPQAHPYTRGESVDLSGSPDAVHDSGIVLVDNKPVSERQSPPTWSSPYPHGHPSPKPQQDRFLAGPTRSPRQAQFATPKAVVEDSRSPEDTLQSLDQTPEPTPDSEPSLPAGDSVYNTPPTTMRSSPPPNDFLHGIIETPVRPTRYGTPPGEATPCFHVATPERNHPSVYETPARFNTQTMPYYVAATAEAATPSIEQFNSEPPVVAHWEQHDTSSAEPGHSPSSSAHAVSDTDAQHTVLSKRKPAKRARVSGLVSDPVPNKEVTRKPTVAKKHPQRSRKVPKRFSLSPADTGESQDFERAPQQHISARTSRRRKIADELSPSPPELDFALIDVIAQALRSRADMCMYRREILAWIADHHGDFQIEGKWDTVLHFHLSGWEGFTNLYPGKYQPLWTLTEEVDSVGFAGRKEKGKEVEAGAQQSSTGRDEELSVNTELPAAVCNDATGDASKDVVNLVTSDAAALPESKAQYHDAFVFGSDDNNNITIARPPASTSVSSRKRRSINTSAGQIARPMKKARHSDPMPPPLLRRVKRERTSTPAFGVASLGRSANLALPSGRRVIFSRGAEQADDDEDELA